MSELNNAVVCGQLLPVPPQAGRRSMTRGGDTRVFIKRECES